MPKDQSALHRSQPVYYAGAPLEDALAAMVLLHGRGATAQSILMLAHDLPHSDLAYLAPQAFGSTWYPYSFLQPLEANEPYLSSALAAVGDVVQHVEGAGIPPERVIIGGFSQGACLALEYAARNARRYGAVLAFSGGLIGPDGTPRDYRGSFEGTPIFIGCSDSDAHVPKSRVLHSDEVLRRMGAEMETRIYPKMGHTIIDDELSAARAIIDQFFAHLQRR